MKINITLWDQLDTEYFPDELFERHGPKRELSTDTDEDMSVDEVRVNQRTKKEHKTRIREAKGP